jgi:hypothetical protein
MPTDRNVAINKQESVKIQIPSDLNTAHVLFKGEVTPIITDAT